MTQDVEANNFDNVARQVALEQISRDLRNTLQGRLQFSRDLLDDLPLVRQFSRDLQGPASGPCSFPENSWAWEGGAMEAGSWKPVVPPSKGYVPEGCHRGP